MKALLTLVSLNLHLSYRVKLAFFFNFIFPLFMCFVYLQMFARGNPLDVARMMGPLISLTVMTNALLVAGMRSAEMRERDMLRQYRLTPVTAFEVVTSELALGFLTFFPVFLAEVAVGVGVYHMPFSGSYLGLCAIASLGYLTLSGLGLLLSSVVNTIQEASVITQLIFIVLLFLSGTTLPFSDLPRFVQQLAIFTPPTLMIVPMEGIILRGDHVAQYLPEILGLLTSCATAILLAVLMFRWDKDEKVPLRNRVFASVAVVPLMIIGLIVDTTARLPRLPSAAREVPQATTSQKR